MGEKNPKILELNKDIEEINKKLIEIASNLKVSSENKAYFEDEVKTLNDLIGKYLYEDDKEANSLENIKKMDIKENLEHLEILEKMN